MIYVLNTKNDEHDHFVARLKATHEEDLDKILTDCTQKLEQCKQKLSLEKEGAEKLVVSLKESLLAVEKERNQLHEEQVYISFCPYSYLIQFLHRFRTEKRLRIEW